MTDARHSPPRQRRFSVEAGAAGRRLPHRRRALGRAGADLCRSERHAAGFLRLLSASFRTDFGTRLPHIFGERARASGAGDPLAAAAHRKHPSANPRRLRRSGGAQGPTTVIGWSRLPTMRPTPSRSSIRRDLDIGSRGGSFSRTAQEPAGPRRAATSPISGRRKWPGPATNIGSPSPRGRHPTRSPSASPEAPPGRAVDRQRRAAGHRQADRHHRPWLRCRTSRR